LSSLLANILLNEVDRELEKRGHCFVRHADGGNVYVGSKQAGQRVMRLLRRCYARLKRKGNETESAIALVFGRKFLGNSFWIGPKGQIKLGLADSDGKTQAPCEETKAAQLRPIVVSHH